MENLNYKKTIKNIRKELKNYLIENNLKSMVVGVSGGIDSALACALAYPIAKELNIELIGRSITIESNSQDEIERAKQIGENFCTNFREVNLTEEYNVLKDSLLNSDIVINKVETDREQKIRLGNVKARMRMIHLYDLSQKNNGLVISTDNYTEYLLGFFTIFGDQGDYAPIQYLWKTEIYNMTEWLAENENISTDASKSLSSMLDAIATDGLGITNSDLDQLIPDWKDRHNTTREGYYEVDQILIEMENNKFDKNNPIIIRNKKSNFKRNHPISLKRDQII